MVLGRFDQLNKFRAAKVDTLFLKVFNYNSQRNDWQERGSTLLATDTFLAN